MHLPTQEAHLVSVMTPLKRTFSDTPFPREAPLCPCPIAAEASEADEPNHKHPWIPNSGASESPVDP